MSLAEIEINKSNEPVFKEEEKDDNIIINANKGPEEITESKKSKSSISSIEDKIEDSFIKEKAVEKKGKEIPSAGPKHIALDERFSYDRIDDDTRMLDVRRKLRYYFKSVYEGDKRKQYDNLDRLKKECDAYCKGRFSIFKWGRGKERLNEVKALKREASEKQKTLYDKTEGVSNLELIYNSPQGYLTNGQAAIVVGRYIIENPIRLALTAIALPFWAINQTIRGVQKLAGKTPIRRLTLPWMHRFAYYRDAQYHKKKLIGFDTYRSFTERFIKHKTDIKAMDRADLDLAMTTEDGFDYGDEEMDDEEFK